MKYIQTQYMHICTYMKQSYLYIYTSLHIYTYTDTCTNTYRDILARRMGWRKGGREGRGRERQRLNRENGEAVGAQTETEMYKHHTNPFNFENEWQVTVFRGGLPPLSAQSDLTADTSNSPLGL